MGGEAFPKLVELMAYLRSPEGCPWDRAQDFRSLKALIIEESYEVIDAIDANDPDSLEDELGDLLFQVVFCARLAEEEGRFNIDGVVERIRAKLIRRHPHVFGERKARTAEEALASWRSVKATEQGNGESEGKAISALDGLAPSLPAALAAHDLGTRAAEAGFDWTAASDVLRKIEEETNELQSELGAAKPSGERIEEEIGDLLFAAANLARKSGTDSESCLRAANRKFERRFRALEREVAGRGKKIDECGAQELDKIWEAVKQKERE